MINAREERQKSEHMVQKSTFSHKWKTTLTVDKQIFRAYRHVQKISTGWIPTSSVAFSPPRALWMNNAAYCWCFGPFASGCYLKSQELPAHHPLRTTSKTPSRFNIKVTQCHMYKYILPFRGDFGWDPSLWLPSFAFFFGNHGLWGTQHRKEYNSLPKLSSSQERQLQGEGYSAVMWQETGTLTLS